MIIFLLIIVYFLAESFQVSEVFRIFAMSNQNKGIMKRVIVLTAMIIGTILPMSAIKEIPVDFECNINCVNQEEHDVHRFSLGSSDGGWCVVKKRNHPGQKVGYGGLYIFRSPYTNEYDEPQFYCVDLMCTVCAQKGIKSVVRKYTLWDVRCDKCHTIFKVTDGRPAASTGRFSLLTYAVDVVRDGWIRVHNDEGLEQRNMLWGDTPY